MEVLKKLLCFETITYFADIFPRDTIRRLRDGSMSNNFFIEKDSTNAVKFSRHLILFVQPGVVFRYFNEVIFFFDRLLNSIHEEALFDFNSKKFRNFGTSLDEVELY